MSELELEDKFRKEITQRRLINAFVFIEEAIQSGTYVYDGSVQNVGLHFTAYKVAFVAYRWSRPPRPQR